MRVIIVTLVLLLGVLQYQLWISKSGFFSTIHARRAIALQQATNEKIAKRNNQLKVGIADLKQGKQAIEARARNELGMVKKDEVFYQVVRSENVEK